MSRTGAFFSTVFSEDCTLWLWVVKRDSLPSLEIRMFQNFRIFSPANSIKSQILTFNWWDKLWSFNEQWRSISEDELLLRLTRVCNSSSRPSLCTAVITNMADKNWTCVTIFMFQAYDIQKAGYKKLWRKHKMLLWWIRQPRLLIRNISIKRKDLELCLHFMWNLLTGAWNPMPTKDSSKRAELKTKKDNGALCLQIVIQKCFWVFAYF